MSVSRMNSDTAKVYALADYGKYLLSDLFDIPIEHFYDRENKENYIVPNTNVSLHTPNKNTVFWSSKYIVDKVLDITNQPELKAEFEEQSGYNIRTLMQNFLENIRIHVHQEVWARKLAKQIKKDLEVNPNMLVIVSDLRHTIDAVIFKELFTDVKIINLEREDVNTASSEHSSEQGIERSLININITSNNLLELVKKIRGCFPTPS